MKGYWQVPLTHNAKKKKKKNSAFVTQDGLYQYNVSNIPKRWCIFFTQNSGMWDLQWWCNHIQHIRERTFTHHQTIFPSTWKGKPIGERKQNWMLPGKGNYLGHIVGHSQVMPITAKVEAILRFPIP